VFLLGNFAETGYLHTESDEELLDGYYELLKSTKKIDYAMLIKAGQLLSNIHNSSILELLRDIKPAEGADPSRDILIDKFVTLGYRDSADVKIPLKGRFIVSGGEGMTYPEEAAIWIDLGGDDTYFGFCGGTPYTIYKNYRHRFGAGRSGLHIDLGGNDTYIRNTEGAIGAGFCGAGCLIDLDGDDRYSGYRLCQGAAFCGTGMLIDMSGSDIYTSQEESQGFAVFGAGLLYDAAGNDLYSGTRFVQGVGVTKGIGLLVDNSGDDRYVGTFKTPNGYGVENTWDGWSQGVGVGFRSVATGGIGLICDRAGNDRYEAGNFSQACGYFFGMGIFQDFDGNDLVIGNRYCQGSGAHQAASLFRDHRGNDRYIGHEATNQAGVWDITAAYFIDDLGDDIYEASSISLGGASQNGFAAFLDGDGCDSYTSLAGATVGAGGGNHYHPEYGAKSLGIFIDLGGDKDDYTKTFEKRKNDKLIISGDDEKEEGGEGIFRDN